MHISQTPIAQDSLLNRSERTSTLLTKSRFGSKSAPSFWRGCIVDCWQWGKIVPHRSAIIASQSLQAMCGFLKASNIWMLTCATALNLRNSHWCNFGRKTRMSGQSTLGVMTSQLSTDCWGQTQTIVATRWTHGRRDREELGLEILWIRVRSFRDCRRHRHCLLWAHLANIHRLIQPCEIAKLIFTVWHVYNSVVANTGDILSVPF